MDFLTTDSWAESSENKQDKAALKPEMALESSDL